MYMYTFAFIYAFIISGRWKSYHPCIIAQALALIAYEQTEFHLETAPYENLRCNNVTSYEEGHM